MSLITFNLVFKEKQSRDFPPRTPIEQFRHQAIVLAGEPTERLWETLDMIQKALLHEPDIEQRVDKLLNMGYWSSPEFFENPSDAFALLWEESNV